MTNTRTGLIGLILLLVVACAPAAQPAPEPSATLDRLLSLVNGARAAGRDCGGSRLAPTHPLRLEPRLGRAAERHSRDMHARALGSPRGSDGRSVRERVTREGYRWARVGENYAWSRGFDMTPAKVMRFWLSSPEHCRNLMSPNYTEIGLAKVGGYWTQVFARPAP
ncbi:MAG: CAP domain-containing protein [Deinococcota bacterium]|nr:CAP domain-containing protein [Deinococcota bacterium]